MAASVYHRYPNKHVSLVMVAAFLLITTHLAFFIPTAQALSPTQPTTQTQETVRRVLVINSYHAGFARTESMMQGIRETFQRSGLIIETYAAFMDTKRIPPTAEYFVHLKELYKKLYANTTFDLVIATDNDALEFLRKYRDELFPGVPLVFTGIDDYNPQMLDGRDDLTGIDENLDFIGTIRVAAQLRPHTNSILVVTDNTTTGKAQRHEAEKLLPQAFPNISFQTTSLGDTTLPELKKQLSGLPDTSAVLLLQCAMDKSGISYPSEYAIPYLIAQVPVPCFVLTDSRMGMGTLGGLISNGSSLGKNAAEMAVGILRGEKISTIPVRDNPNLYIFDYPVMQRFGISPRDLPPGSIIRNQPSSMIDLYRSEVIAACLVFCTTVVFLFLLLFENVRRRKIEKSLRESEQRFRAVLEQASDGFELLNAAGHFVDVNLAVCRQLGYTREELLQKKIWDIDPQLTPDLYAQRFQMLMTTPLLVFETIHTRKDGAHMSAEISISLVQLHGIHHIMGIARDITERKQAEEEKSKLEDQLRQSQKMEAVGRLAGGVAHDFNNMLSIILGYCDMLQSDIPPPAPIYPAIDEIANAAKRSAELTRQLLAFSRKQAVVPAPLDLREHLRAMERLLKRTIGEDVKLEFIFPPDLWKVFMDPSQVDQIAANLAVNSRDAMPNGGKLSIETRNVTLDADFCQIYENFHPGDYVILSVNDSGSGMSKEILEHVFEPFFTTKGEGKGTGLGMATVYGIVRQNNGLVKIYSEPGYGTSVSIYLPRHQELQKASEAIATQQASIRAGTETILLVEDEEQLRKLILHQLTRLGYQVLEAATPAEAIEINGWYTENIDILLTDIIMPGMNGKDLSQIIKERRPGTHIIFMSGYTADTIEQHGVLKADVHFLQKPFSRKALAEKIRSTLES